MKCPICNGELEERYLENGQKRFYCKNCIETFCEHILKATRKDIEKFACGNCDSPIDKCNCLNCGAGVFCSECNDFVTSSCSIVMDIIYKNEELLKKKQLLNKENSKMVEKHEKEKQKRTEIRISD